jgi:hypothetical protein
MPAATAGDDSFVNVCRATLRSSAESVTVVPPGPGRPDGDGTEFEGGAAGAGRDAGGGALWRGVAGAAAE